MTMILIMCADQPTSDRSKHITGPSESVHMPQRMVYPL